MNRQQRRAAARAGIRPAELRPMTQAAFSLADLSSEESAEAMFRYALERHQAKEMLDTIMRAAYADTEERYKEKILADVEKRFKDKTAALVLDEIHASEDLCGAVYFTAFVMAANKVFNFREECKKIIDEVPDFVQIVEKDPKGWFTKINEEYGLGLETDIFDGDETFLDRVDRYVRAREM